MFVLGLPVLIRSGGSLDIFSRISHLSFYWLPSVWILDSIYFEVFDSFNYRISNLVLFYCSLFTLRALILDADLVDGGISANGIILQ